MEKISLKTLTFKQITALFCVVTVLFSLLFFSASSVRDTMDAYKIAKESYKEAKENLETKQKELEQAQAKYDQTYNENKDKLADLEKKADRATEKLEDVCSNSSFSSSRYSSCRYNDYECKELHAAAETAKRIYNDFKEDLNLEELEENVSIAENAVSSAQNRLENATEYYEELKPENTAAVFTVIGYLLTAASLVAIAVYLYLQYLEEEKKVVILSALGAGALGNIILLFAGKIPFIVSPHFYSLILFGMFALILNKEENHVKYRVVAIVAAVLAYLFSLFYGAGVIVGLFYAVSMILFAFVLVPLDFKEYIKVSKHILLSIVTFGIWLFVWIYYVSKNLNKASSMEQRTPKNELLLCMFLPFYAIYWLFKNAEYIEAYAKDNGKNFSISILCFVLGFVSPLLSTVIMQDKINQIVGKPE